MLSPIKKVLCGSFILLITALPAFSATEPAQFDMDRARLLSFILV